MQGPASLDGNGTIREGDLERGNGMVGRSTRPTGPLLKLFLSPSTITATKREAIFQAARLSRPKHGRDRSFLGSLIAVKLALLGNKLMLLAPAEVLGKKLGLFKGVFRLLSHQTGPLRDDLTLLHSDPMKDFTGGADDGVRELHPGALGHAGVVSLSVLSQGGEGVERFATTIVPEGEALCLWEGPDFHAGSQGLVFRSRQKCDIVLGGRPLIPKPKKPN